MNAFSFILIESVLIFISCRIIYSSEANTMRAAQFEPGGPEKLYIGEVPIPALRSKEVLLKVYATGINRADTLQRKGFYPAPPGESDILGLEATGKVEKLGDGCSGKWKIGDRVMALLPGGGNAEYVACYEDHLFRVPDSFKFTQAAAIPEVWLTAFQISHFVGNLQPGETVLVHAGGSGVGTAAVQLIKLAGAKSIVTAGSQEKIQKAVSLGAEVGFNYKTQKFGDEVKNYTQGNGVNLILDCVGTSFYEENIKAIAMDGRWVVYGSMGKGKLNEDILSSILMKRLTIKGSTLRKRSVEYKTELIQSFQEKALPYFETGQLEPIIDTVFPLDKLSEAHQYMEDNKNTGKIVIQVREEDGHEEL